ncbi:hypothetical protein [Rahnella sp. PCH160]|uniref:hypothetical protein n=1 Tax=Rahnella sp. PCH160 TaxID=3447928 RepID=UPI0039FCFF07
MDTRRKWNKFIKIILSVIFIIVILLEGSMRFAIWRALKETIPEGVEYELKVYYANNSDYYCKIEAHDNYMTFIYTIGILTTLQSKMFCKWQSEHMTLYIDDYNTPTGRKYQENYYWSYRALSFIKY